MTPEISSVMTERGKVYGEPHLSHENIGLAWTGLIQQHYEVRLDHPLPSWLVEMMLASFKIHRSARVFHSDNFLDCRAYLAFAEHGQQKPNESYQIPKPIESIHDR
jgi:hypothetical protein